MYTCIHTYMHTRAIRKIQYLKQRCPANQPKNMHCTVLQTDYCKELQKELGRCMGSQVYDWAAITMIGSSFTHHAPCSCSDLHLLV